MLEWFALVLPLVGWAPGFRCQFLIRLILCKATVRMKDKQTRTRYRYSLNFSLYSPAHAQECNIEVPHVYRMHEICTLNYIIWWFIRKFQFCDVLKDFLIKLIERVDLSFRAHQICVHIFGDLHTPTLLDSAWMLNKHTENVIKR